MASAGGLGWPDEAGPAGPPVPARGLGWPVDAAGQAVGEAGPVRAEAAPVSPPPGLAAATGRAGRFSRRLRRPSWPRRAGQYRRMTACMATESGGTWDGAGYRPLGTLASRETW